MAGFQTGYLRLQSPPPFFPILQTRGMRCWRSPAGAPIPSAVPLPGSSPVLGQQLQDVTNGTRSWVSPSGNYASLLGIDGIGKGKWGGVSIKSQGFHPGLTGFRVLRNLTLAPSQLKCSLPSQCWVVSTNTWLRENKEKEVKINSKW